jgi:hypothetical protein
LKVGINHVTLQSIEEAPEQKAAIHASDKDAEIENVSGEDLDLNAVDHNYEP